MEEKIQEEIEKKYYNKIISIDVTFKDFRLYIIECIIHFQKAECKFNFCYKYYPNMSIEWNIKEIENIIDKFIISIFKNKEEK